MKSDFYAVVSILAAITARQEQIQWWLGCTAALVAIIAGSLAIWQKLRPRSNAQVTPPPPSVEG